MDFFSDFKNKIQSNLCGKPGQGESIATIPQQFTIKGRLIQEEKLLTEGAFGYIWRARDVQSNEIFALKRMMCTTDERLEVARTEMKILEKLPRDHNIVNYFGGSILPYDGGKIVVFLMELCEGGSLFELMEQKQYSKFQEYEIIDIVKQICKGVNSLHRLNPPMAHRDIKIENVLISHSSYKVCDFGSCSSQVVDFSQIHQSEYVDYEEVFEKTTTPMYRPPEICDPYQGFLVNEKCDVWMIGCVMYTLCFFIHPFVEGQKIGICEAKFNIPKNSQYSEKLHDLIRHMLTPNPRFRPNVSQLLDILNQYNHIDSIQLNQQAQQIKQQNINREQEEQAFNSNKRQINDDGGDISIEEIMRMQKKIQQESKDDDFSFANQRQKKVQQQQKMVQQQIKRKNPQQQQKQQFSSNNGSNKANYGSNSGFDSFNGSSFNQSQNKPNTTSNNQQWDSWNSGSQQQNQNNSNNSGWDQQWSSTNNSSSQNQQNNQQQAKSQFQQWDQWNNNNSNQNNQQQQQQANQNQNGFGWDNQQQQQSTNLLGLSQQQQHQPQQQQFIQNQQQQQYQQQPKQQQQQQVNFADDLLDIGVTPVNNINNSNQQQPQQPQQQQNLQQQANDLTDLLF